MLQSVLNVTKMPYLAQVLLLLHHVFLDTTYQQPILVLLVQLELQLVLPQLLEIQESLPVVQDTSQQEY